MADRRPLVFSLYRGLARALTPLFNLLFWLRSRSGKELPARKGERFDGAQQAGLPASLSGSMRPVSVKPYPCCRWSTN